MLTASAPISKEVCEFLKIYKQIDNSILTDDIFNELTERLIEEVDYLQEAKNINYYQFNNCSLHWEIRTPNVLRYTHISNTTYYYKDDDDDKQLVPIYQILSCARKKVN